MKHKIILILLIFQSGCLLFDAGNSESKKIVGNIYVINSDVPNSPGYYPIFLEKSGYERHLIKSDEHIDEIIGNDSIILISTIPNPEIAYYLIKHSNGDSILTIKSLSQTEYGNYEKNIEIKYSFIANQSGK